LASFVSGLWTLMAGLLPSAFGLVGAEIICDVYYIFGWRLIQKESVARY
jgi:hypothetical protein